MVVLPDPFRGIGAWKNSMETQLMKKLRGGATQPLPRDESVEELHELL